jgi:hypothetical protein
MMAESVLIMNVITDKLRGKYLLRIKTLVSSDINGEHFTIVRTKKNIDFMYEYGLSIEDVKNIILNLSTEDCFSGPENDRDLRYEGWIFKFSPMFENVKLYNKIRVESSEKSVCLSVHEFGKYDEVK